MEGERDVIAMRHNADWYETCHNEWKRDGIAMNEKVVKRRHR